MSCSVVNPGSSGHPAILKSMGLIRRGASLRPYTLSHTHTQAFHLPNAIRHPNKNCAHPATRQGARHKNQCASYINRLKSPLRCCTLPHKVKVRHVHCQERNIGTPKHIMVSTTWIHHKKGRPTPIPRDASILSLKSPTDCVTSSGTLALPGIADPVMHVLQGKHPGKSKFLPTPVKGRFPPGLRVPRQHQIPYQ